MNDNDFILKFKQLDLDMVNSEMESQLQVFNKYCNKKVVLSMVEGQMWEGILRGYDMFSLHLERNGQIEKFLLPNIDKIKEM